MQAVAVWLNEGGVDARCAELKDVTLLMAAACGGQEPMVRMLLRRGASVNLQDSFSFTALMIAANNGHTMIVQALLDAKADASLQDKKGETALMLAELRQEDAVAQLLRQHVEWQAASAEAWAGASAAHAAAAADVSVASAAGAKSDALKVISTLTLTRIPALAL